MPQQHCVTNPPTPATQISNCGECPDFWPQLLPLWIHPHINEGALPLTGHRGALTQAYFCNTWGSFHVGSKTPHHAVQDFLSPVLQSGTLPIQSFLTPFFTEVSVGRLPPEGSLLFYSLTESHPVNLLDIEFHVGICFSKDLT